MAYPLPRKLFIFLILAGIAAAGIYFWQARAGDKAEAKYKTQRADIGDIEQSISANGTLNPVVLVNVGTQVSGTVQKLHADFNDRIATGQILAELDPALLEAQLKQAQANVSNAEAGLKLAAIKEKRSRDLLAKQFISQTQMDEARQALAAAQAQLATARAQLERDRANLHYSVIRSPISGVVVARNVDLGQTVAASFQTPTLFQIARDLKEMQIDTSIAEADIGMIRLGQPVRFNVDAFPARDFEGRVKQIRLSPTIQQNVVTYNVVVAVDNADGKLMPGMTAHVYISVNHRNQVLRIPNAALRFKPSAETTEDTPKKQKPGGATVYRLSGDRAEPLKLKIGAADNTYTEVSSGEVKAGDALIIKELGNKKNKDGSSFKLRMF